MDNIRDKVSLWSFVLCAIAGLSVGYMASTLGSFALSYFSPSAGIADASVSGTQASGSSSSRSVNLSSFLASNPFHVSSRKPPEPVKVEEPAEPAPAEPAPLEAILRGTFPGIGAWLEHDGNMELVLVGNNLDRWRLTSVNYDSVTFRRGRERKTFYLTYGPTVAATPTPPPAPPAPKRAAARKNTGDVQEATEQSEGAISAELVNSLVQNPFDELKRIRLRPNDKEGGLEVQWIQNDSILRQLGVRRGDVIRSVNGIPFTNMGDIANSINSLMNSERFDVEVTRGGKNTPLRYVVK
ncbi:MAG: hypothetical protein IJT02_01295 [Synergistaceae bacterium]|nr:hypothetical protein [Synergistaceae bacterium]